MSSGSSGTIARGDPREQGGVGLEEVLVEVLTRDLSGPQRELAGEPAAGVDVTRQALIHVPYSRSMRILIIGGTRFVGQAMAQAALDSGHDVSLLHRHATDELPGATHLLADRDGDLSVLDEKSYDATIDVCAYVPGQVRRLHEGLGDRGGHHLFISTVSVYQEPEGPGADEDSPLFAPASEDATEVTNESYGPMKVTCENIATEALRRERAGDRPPDVRRGPARHDGPLSVVAAAGCTGRDDDRARAGRGADAVHRRPRHGCLDDPTGRGQRDRGLHRGPAAHDVRRDARRDARRGGQRRPAGAGGR